ncbi:MAG TPA: hypothetical protein VFG51_02335 [Candidatus Saccharimonadia bacterium]|nr:hypothetical protein [Candidatus Saccharimonadia bacterium]
MPSELLLGDHSSQDITTAVVFEPPKSLHVFEQSLLGYPKKNVSIISAFTQHGIQYLICYVGPAISVYRYRDVVEVLRRHKIPQSRIVLSPEMDSGSAEELQRELTAP